jgi:hypothetical protein
MSRKLTIAIITVLMLGSASAAMAQSIPPSPNSYACQTDEGYGRTNPCDAGGG